MHNKIVYQAAKGMVEAGLVGLRFNFRGAGDSEGVHDAGRGEQDDVAAALELLEQRFPGLPQVVAGFSFGATAGLRAAGTRSQVKALIGIGLPLEHASFDFLLEETRPLLLIHGDNDPFGPVDELRKLAADIGPSVRLHVMEGTGHLFEGRVSTIRDLVREFCAAHVGGGGTP